jgi:hypothetical protein
VHALVDYTRRRILAAEELARLATDVSSGASATTHAEPQRGDQA